MSTAWLLLALLENCRIVGILENEMETTGIIGIKGDCRQFVGVITGLGFRGYIGILEKKMETTILYRVLVG